jgi:hypothetical protein
VSEEEKEKSFSMPGLEHENLWIKILSLNTNMVGLGNEGYMKGAITHF